MISNLVNIYLVIIGVGISITSLASIYSIGKEREPITAGIATANIVISFLATLCIIAKVFMGV